MTRAQFLPFAQPTIDDSDVEEVVEVLRSGWLTSGPRIAQFEQEFAAQIRADSALAVSSGTAAMHVALNSFDLGQGKAIITTPLTFCSTAHVIEQLGCRPLFVDVDPGTLNIDPAAIENAVQGDPGAVAAILPVHYAGHPCEMDEILDIAHRYGLPVVEDAAHAFGAVYRGRAIGEIAGSDAGRAACFSLYATKNITSGEGGVLTASKSIVEKSRLWSLHGMSRDSWQRYGPSSSWEYEVLVPGFKYNMSDIQAALAVAQLRRWRSLQKRRTEIAELYTELLGGCDELELPAARAHVTHAWHLYPLRLGLQRLGIDRRVFIDELRIRNIGTSVHFIPVHMHPYYRERYGYRSSDFPIAAAEFERLISLPIYPRMTDGDVHDVATAVLDVVQRHRDRGR